MEKSDFFGNQIATTQTTMTDIEEAEKTLSQFLKQVEKNDDKYVLYITEHDKLTNEVELHIDKYRQTEHKDVPLPKEITVGIVNVLLRMIIVKEIVQETKTEKKKVPNVRRSSGRLDMFLNQETIKWVYVMSVECDDEDDFIDELRVNITRIDILDKHSYAIEVDRRYVLEGLGLVKQALVLQEKK